LFSGFYWGQPLASCTGAAAIIVLLVMLVLMNSIAIALRDRF
jgi:hypothetical protein